MTKEELFYQSWLQIFAEVFPLLEREAVFLKAEKKYKVVKTNLIASQLFSISILNTLLESQDFDTIIKSYLKVLGLSYIPSTFEKIALQNMFKLEHFEKEEFSHLLCDFIHNNGSLTFEAFSLFMAKYGCAKWTNITAILHHCHPFEEIFIKPTSIKKAEKVFNVNIGYSPKANYETYLRSKDLILSIHKVTQTMFPSKDLGWTQTMIYFIESAPTKSELLLFKASME